MAVALAFQSRGREDSWLPRGAGGSSPPWAQPVVAFDLAESVGQDAPCARC